MSNREEILNNLYHDCKEQLLHCKRFATAAKTEAEATFEFGKACGIISIFTKAYGISDQSIELNEIANSINDHEYKAVERDACVRLVTTRAVKENGGFCPLCDSEIDLSEEQQ